MGNNIFVLSAFGDLCETESRNENRNFQTNIVMSRTPLWGMVDGMKEHHIMTTS